MHQKFLLSAISLVGLLVCNPAFARSACVQPAELATANGQGEPEENEKKSSAASKPQVEVFVPSIERLSAAARRSRTAQIYRGLSAMLPSLENETGEGLNVEAVVKLLSRVRSWDDTSLAIAIFTQDREGRPRWLIRVDWPVTKLVERVREVLADEAGKEIFKNIELKEGDDGVYRLELPEMELAVLKSHADGSMIASAASVAMPAKIFGLETKSPRNDSAKKKSFLAYCSLNLDAGEEEQKGSSFFSGIAGISAVRYVVSLNKDAEWVEQFAVSWNPLLGAAIKLAVQKARHPFDCPNDAYAVAVLNLGLGEGMADALTGLPIGTIGDRAGSEMLFAAVPGTGFLPIPDTFYVLRAQGRTEIIQSIRKAIRKETSRRAEDDLPPRWREMNIDGKTVFWRDPAADGSYGLIPMTFRTVIFFDGPGSNDEDEDSRAPVKLVIANTSTWADDAVRHWADLSKSTIKLPSSKKVHWQARVNWARAYELLHPYLGILAGFTEGASVPPDAEAMGDALSDSDVQIKIGFGGVRVKHVGPIPLGAAYVPAVTGMALGASADASSDAAREKFACQNLRVLHYHAKLFKKDYGRWPANVAELDGYVDFASHPHLLYLRRRDRSFVEGLKSALFSGGNAAAKKDEENEDDADIDDSLYEIRWSDADEDWRLAFREDEFSNYKTVYIDGTGEIHRVPNDPPPPLAKAKKDESVEGKRSATKRTADKSGAKSKADSQSEKDREDAADVKKDRNSEPDKKEKNRESDDEKEKKPKRKRVIRL